MSVLQGFLIQYAIQSSGFSSAANEVDEIASLSEDILYRQMSDQLTRLQQVSPVQSRMAMMQRLMSKIAVLSDREFQRTYETLESLVEKYTHSNSEQKEKKSSEKNSMPLELEGKRKDILSEIKEKIDLSKK